MLRLVCFVFVALFATFSGLIASQYKRSATRVATNNPTNKDGEDVLYSATTTRSAGGSHLRGEGANTVGAPQEYHECTLHLTDVLLDEDGTSMELVTCEDAVGANLEVRGLETHSALQGWQQGHTRIKVPRTHVNSQDGILDIKSSSDIIVDIGKERKRENDMDVDVDSHERRLAVTGVRKVLVVRVSAGDSAMTFTAEQVGNSIFGISSSIVPDVYTLASQYDACSNGKLKMEPVTHASVNAYGVVEVSIDQNLASSSSIAMQSAAATILNKDKGINVADYDHTMYCLPDEITPKIVAWAHLGDRTSVYRNKFCLSLSTQMHEVGHNLGLGHSGLGTNNYLDRSGYMGYSGAGNDTPLKCFNGGKSYQLGWYSDRTITMNPTNSAFRGKLVGVAHYKDSESEHTVIVHVQTPTGIDDVFISYNQAVGINFQTHNNFKNKVLVTQDKGGGSPSWSIGQLSAASAQEFNVGLGQPLIVRTLDIGSDTISSGGVDVDYMVVQVGLQCSNNAPCAGSNICDDGMCAPPVTGAEVVSEAPSAQPTSKPSAHPSDHPSGSSSDMPSATPSRVPSESTSSPNDAGGDEALVLTTTDAASVDNKVGAIALMYDVQAGTVASDGGVLVTAIDILTTKVGTMTTHVWTNSGTAATATYADMVASGESTMLANGWTKQTLQANGLGINNGVGGLTPFTLTTPIVVPPGQTQVFYIELGDDLSGELIALSEKTCGGYGTDVTVDTASGSSSTNASSHLSVKGGYTWISATQRNGGPNDATPKCFSGALHYKLATLIDTGSSSWTLLDREEFESGWGKWKDGGSDASRSSNSNYATTGDYSIRLRDDSNTGKMTHDAMNVSQFSQIKVEFNFYVRSMEVGEIFLLEISDPSVSNGSWQRIKEYKRNGADESDGTEMDIDDNSYHSDVVTFDASSYGSGGQFRIRFRCDASSNGDMVYIDDVAIYGWS
jgi:hypothetical protein